MNGLFRVYANDTGTYGYMVISDEGVVGDMFSDLWAAIEVPTRYNYHSDPDTYKATALLLPVELV